MSMPSIVGGKLYLGPPLRPPKPQRRTFSRWFIILLLFTIAIVAIGLFKVDRTRGKFSLFGNAIPGSPVQDQQFLVERLQERLGSVHAERQYDRAIIGDEEVSKRNNEGKDQKISTETTLKQSQESIVLAYCVYPQRIRPGEPVIGAEYFARILGPLIFPDRKLEIVTCLAVPEQLPTGVEASSETGLRLLGMLDVHLRFCSYGSSATLKETFGKLNRDIKLSGVLPSSLNEGEIENLHWPPQQFLNLYLSQASRRVVGPMVTRTNREAWRESVPGVAVQFDTKLSPRAGDSLTVYMPYAYESFGRSRWNGGDSKRVIERHQESFGRNDMFELRESVTRPSGFNARAERVNKKYFMSMVNSNCRDTMPTTMVRGLFTYAVHQLLGKPVHNLGACPKGDEGAKRAGITPAQRAAFAKQWPVGKGSPTPAQEIFAHHKFAICFENNDVEGYITEKIVTPYVARTIPVYWGGGSVLKQVINPKAFVHCELPNNITGLLQPERYPQFIQQICKKKEGDDSLDAQVCGQLISDEFYRRMMPFFRPCIEQIRRLDEDDEAYEQMLQEPLAPTDPQTGQLAGFWNETKYAVAIRAAFNALGYAEGPRELRKALGMYSGS